MALLDEHAVVDEVLPIEVDDVDRAGTVLLGRWSLSARDALHVAVMQRCSIERILSFDRGLDDVPGIERLRCPILFWRRGPSLCTSS